MFCNCISLSRLTCDCLCVIDVLGLVLIPLPLFSGDDEFDDVDPSLAEHYDALGYDVSFRS